MPGIEQRLADRYRRHGRSLPPPRRLTAPPTLQRRPRDDDRPDHPDRGLFFAGGRSRLDHRAQSAVLRPQS